MWIQRQLRLTLTALLVSRHCRYRSLKQSSPRISQVFLSLTLLCSQTFTCPPPRKLPPKPHPSSPLAQTTHPLRDAGGSTTTPSCHRSASPGAQQEGEQLCEQPLPKRPPAAPTAWPCLESAKNLWGREEQSTLVPTHSPIIIPCFTSKFIYLEAQCHTASCDHRELAVPLLQNFPFPLPKYF